MFCQQTSLPSIHPVADTHIQEASFIKQAWYHPATQAAIDDAFGTALKPLRRHCDVGYVNVQLSEGGPAAIYDYTEVPAVPKPAMANKDNDESLKSKWDDVPIDAWHRDQVPAVCVVMLSDTSTMAGGETAIRKADGTILKARGANLGGAVLMQGGNLPHAAMRASNCTERVSMVTSYSFADPDLDDSRCTLKTADTVNEDMASIRYAHMDYKLRKLRDRLDTALQRLDLQRASGATPDRNEIEPWVREQISFLKQTSWELFERAPNYMEREVPDEVLREYLSDV